MKTIWTVGNSRAKRFTCTGYFRHIKLVDRNKDVGYCLGPGHFYCGQLPMEVVDIEGRERAKRDLKM